MIMMMMMNNDPSSSSSSFFVCGLLTQRVSVVSPTATWPSSPGEYPSSLLLPAPVRCLPTEHAQKMDCTTTDYQKIQGVDKREVRERARRDLCNSSAAHIFIQEVRRYLLLTEQISTDLVQCLPFVAIFLLRWTDSIVYIIIV